jgi:hypothetical protein
VRKIGVFLEGLELAFKTGSVPLIRDVATGVAEFEEANRDNAS